MTLLIIDLDGALSGSERPLPADSTASLVSVAPLSRRSGTGA